MKEKNDDLYVTSRVENGRVAVAGPLLRRERLNRREGKTD